jgi:hypothetical protein
MRCLWQPRIRKAGSRHSPNTSGIVGKNVSPPRLRCLAFDLKRLRTQLVSDRPTRQTHGRLDTRIIRIRRQRVLLWPRRAAGAYGDAILGGSIPSPAYANRFVRSRAGILFTSDLGNRTAIDRLSRAPLLPRLRRLTRRRPSVPRRAGSGDVRETRAQHGHAPNLIKAIS